jgi:filamentous hemagglutinin family protein
MNKAPTAKLSLRKLLIAMLAIGPVGILPSPVWATLPTSASYTVTNGSATLSSGLNSVTISIPDRTVLQWGTGNFNIGTAETYQFAFNTAGNGAVLNRLNSGDTATINGQLVSDGRVLVLAPNGAISIGNGALINTAGFVASTVNETSDGAFTTTGNLTNLGGIASGGLISVASGVSVVGGMSLTGNQVTIGSAAVNGDLIVTTIGSAQNLVLNTGNLAVAGNLTVTTNNGTITGASAAAITVGTPASFLK